MNYNKITEIATDRRISIPQLAEKIGMSKRGLYVALKENSMRIDTLEKIAKVLEIPISVFFDSGNENEPGEILKKLETAKENLANQAKSYSELEAKYDNLLIINSLNEKLVESAIRETALKEKIIYLLDDAINSIQFSVDEHLKVSFMNEYPELYEKNDRDAWRNYLKNNQLYMELMAICKPIEPWFRQRLTSLLENNDLTLDQDLTNL